MIYCALNHDDVLLARLFGDRLDGLYINDGANHPSARSVTKHFYDLCGSGINVEPNLVVSGLLRSERPRDLNLGIGLSSAPGRMVFHGVVDDSGLSTFDDATAAQARLNRMRVVPEDVEVRTLADVCDEHARGREIDFLKVDVEGHETEVLAGADFTRFRPKALVIEATLPNTNTLVHQSWEPGLLEAGYHFAFFDGFNRYYVRNEDSHLLPRLAYPVNFQDGFVSINQATMARRLRQYGQYGRVALAVARATQSVANLTHGLRRKFGDMRRVDPR